MRDIAPRERAQTRVLVVDDSTIVRRYMREALERAEFAVEEAFNGVEALEKILAHPFDLLVVDINMPKMDGYTFLRALRRRADAHAAIPALMTSTEAGPQDIDAAEAAGANYYLVKPVSQDDLVLHAKALTGRSP
jgi:two-component system, chemotaxis family, chemotaxis protein CheY